MRRPLWASPAAALDPRLWFHAVAERSHVFVNRFTCEGEESARKLVNALLVAGLYPELHAPQLPTHQWEVVAAVSLVPTRENLEELREDMELAAGRAGASYDGCDPERLSR